MLVGEGWRGIEVMTPTMPMTFVVGANWHLRVAGLAGWLAGTFYPRQRRYRNLKVLDPELDVLTAAKT